MPTPDDYDPVQDRKAERERRNVESLAAAVAEIEDVPGTRIPTEHLCDTPQVRAVGRKRLRLLMAFDLYTALLTGHMNSARGDHAEVRKWCWRQADLFMGEADVTPTPPAPPTTATSLSRLPVDQQTYLTWLAGFGNEGVPPSAHHPVLGPELSSVARRALHKAGLIESCPWEDTHGFRVSGAGTDVIRGRRAVCVNGGPHTGDAVKLAEIEGAA